MPRRHLRRALVVCDSLGSDYGAAGYAGRLRDLAAARDIHVDVRVFGGVPLTQVIDHIRENAAMAYDVAIIHVGNPDVHPRLPRAPLAALRRLGLWFMRDGLFTLLPRLSWQWLFRVPLFLFRRAVIQWRAQYFADPDQIVMLHRRLVEHVGRRAGRIWIVPLFEVDRRFYGQAHNQRAALVNAVLRGQYGGAWVDAPWTDSSFYKRFYALDRYHFRQTFHDHVAQALLPLLLDASRRA